MKRAALLLVAVVALGQSSAHEKWLLELDNKVRDITDNELSDLRTLQVQYATLTAKVDAQHDMLLWIGGGIGTTFLALVAMCVKIIGKKAGAE